MSVATVAEFASRRKNYLASNDISEVGSRAQPSIGSYPLLIAIGCSTRKRVSFECFWRFYWYVSRLLNYKRFFSPLQAVGFSVAHLESLLIGHPAVECFHEGRYYFDQVHLLF